jgi:anti-sigma factor RsiW
MEQDELEFRISQYVDGTLEGADRSELERRLQTDAAAQALLEEHRAVTVFVRSAPLPEIRWDRLAETISSAIDDEMDARVQRVSWAIRLARRPAWIAVAASVLIAAGVAVHYLAGPKGTGPVPVGPQSHAGTLLVQVSEPDRPEGPVVSEISIGAGGAYAKDSSLAPYADDIDSRPSHVIIASGASTQPPANLPF